MQVESDKIPVILPEHHAMKARDSVMGVKLSQGVSLEQ